MPSGEDSHAAAFLAACHAAGFDVTAAFDTRSFNTAADPKERLPDFDRDGAYAVLVAHSRAVWPLFLAWLRRDPRRIDAGDPFDTYSEEQLRRAAATTLGRHTFLWAHRTEPRPIPIQRLAQVAGVAHLSPTHLSIHPTFGPWIGLRAVVVLDADGPGGPRVPPDPCGTCSQACSPAYRRVAERPLNEQTWLDWLAVRDACPVGKVYRYDPVQLAYHYTKDLDLLRRALSDPG